MRDSRGYQAMSWGLTKLTVACHGLPPGWRAASQSMNCWRISGSIACPWPAAPLGEGHVPEPGQLAVKPYCS
jgi:hypothetical protein